MLLCYGLGVMYNGRLADDAQGTVTALMNAGSMDTQTAVGIHEIEQDQDNPVYFTIMGEKENALIKNQEFQKSTTVTLVNVCSSTQLLFKGMTALDENDLEGCLIDRNTAIALYGSTEVIGQKLEYEGKLFTIRQVIDEKRQVLVVQARGSEAALDSVIIQTSDKDKGNEEAREFLSRHGIDAKVMEFQLLKEISGALLLMLPFCIAVGLLIKLVKSVKQEKKEGGSTRWWILAACFMGALIIFAILKFVSIPKDMIPTKWSDFDFWVQIWEQKKEALLFLIQSPKRQIQIDMIVAFFQSIGFAVAAIILYVVSFRKSK